MDSLRIMGVVDVFKIRASPLAVSEAVALLLQATSAKEKICTLPPVTPKGGEIYIYQSESDKQRDDWRCDQHKWVNQGVKLLPKTDPQVQKSYFQISLPGGPSKEFTKHAYNLLPPHQCNMTLIHYLGNEKTAVPSAHGNSKADSARNFIRTCPSVLNTLKEKCETTTPMKVYRSEITKLPNHSHLSVKQPRDIKQVKNIRSQLSEKKRLSHDALYNLHELAIDIPEFIHSIQTHPDLVCVCGHKTMFDEMDRVILLDSPGAQLLSYDTTFQLGDFYVSVLSFKHVLFKENPVIPVAFMFHERKFQTVHEHFFEMCCKLSPAISKTHKPIVTDEERGIVNAVAKHMVSSPNLRCWNHIFRDAMRWLRAHGAPSIDVSVYMSDLRNLFHLSTREEYNDELAKMSKKWSAVFLQYYSAHISPDIKSIARWAIEPLGVYNPFSGVTNNQAEGMNFVLKHLLGWQEVPLDCVVLAIHYLQAYYRVEIARGKQNMGNYHLYSMFSSIAETKIAVITDDNAYQPEEIVQRIRENLNETSLSQTINISCSKATNEKKQRNEQVTQNERARRIIEEHKISLDPNLKTFTVMGTDRPHVVTLFPKESCSCPSTSTCYHILAAKLSIGETCDDATKKKLNLTRLRKNARSRSDKTSGRKVPRQGDYDVYPAPDAIIETTASTKQDKSDQNLSSKNLEATILCGNKINYTTDSTEVDEVNECVKIEACKEPLFKDGETTTQQKPQMLHTIHSSKDQKIVVYLGDIADMFVADVIVNAANGALQHIGGVAKAIANKGGPVIQRISDEYVNEHGLLQEGEVWMTNQVGNLHCKALVHAVGPKWKGGHLQEDSLLYKVCNNSLKAAEGYKSICIPAISSGIFNFPIEKCAMIITKAIMDYYLNNPQSSITCTNLCLYSESDAESFIKALKTHQISDNTDLPPSDISARDQNEKLSDSLKSQVLSKTEKTEKCRNESAVNLAKAVRVMKRDGEQHKRSSKRNDHGQDIVMLDDSGDLGEGSKYWIENLGLLVSDKRILECKRSWLNASIIDTSQRLLATQFTGISGFQSVGCSFTMSFSIHKTFIQIIHDESRNHWLTISTLDTDEPIINVYDSLFRELSPSTEQQIACIINTHYNQINAQFIDVQRQSGSNDCGLFSIAFATTLCFGKQPENICYNQSLMRNHLLKCIERGAMEEFPTARVRRLKTKKITCSQTINVYCTCRMPQIRGIPMISCSECEEWYHGNICVSVDDKAWMPNVTWYCCNCKKC